MSENSDCEMFLRYLEQPHVRVDCLGPITDTESAEATCLRHEEFLGRSKLAMITRIASGQELSSDILTNMMEYADHLVKMLQPCSKCQSAGSVDSSLRDALRQYTRLQGNIEKQSRSLSALLMLDAANIRKKWRRRVLGSGGSVTSETMLHCNIFCQNLFDDSEVEACSFRTYAVK